MMMTNSPKRIAAGIALGLLFLTACGGAAAPASTTVPTKPTLPPFTLDLGTKGDELAFDKTALVAPAGTRITLRFSNNAGAGSGMLHNVVVIKPGTNDGVAADGIAAGEAAGYIKPNDSRVIAFSKLIKGGEKTEFSFDAPAPGDYPVICTFPGHYVLMKLTLSIK